MITIYLRRRSSMKFYICKHCGNLITFVQDQGVPVVCCGQEMTELVANTTDAAVEKHVPVIEVNGQQVTVKVSTVAHPMVEKHFIQWIALETKQGIQLKYLHPEESPETVFALAEGDEVIAAYAYCNLHGLWKQNI